MVRGTKRKIGTSGLRLERPMGAEVRLSRRANLDYRRRLDPESTPDALASACSSLRSAIPRILLAASDARRALLRSIPDEHGSESLDVACGELLKRSARSTVASCWPRCTTRDRREKTGRSTPKYLSRRHE